MLLRQEQKNPRSKLSSPDGSVGRWVNVDFNLRPTGPITDPFSHLPGSPVGVWQVVEPGQGIRQEAYIGTAETEASALWPPFPSPNTHWSSLALLGLVFVWSVQNIISSQREALGHPNNTPLRGKLQNVLKQESDIDGTS